eukprot:IDg45t1
MDALGKEDKIFTFEFVKSRLLQDEQRTDMRVQTSIVKSEAAALVAHNHSESCFPFKYRPKCDHCGMIGHVVAKCWKKNPHMRPAFTDRRKKRSALIVGSHIHMTYDRSLFSSCSELSPGGVEMGNKATAKVTGKGNITVELKLLSVPTMDKLGLDTSFKHGRCLIITDSKTIASGSLPNGLYHLDLADELERAMGVSLQRWHERLAHVDQAGIKKMIDHGVVKGAALNSNEEPGTSCNGCIMGKSHRAPIPKKSDSRASAVLDLVQSDVVGPLEVQSIGGSHYFITFIDDNSKWTVEYAMRNKSETIEYFKKFPKQAEAHTGRRLKVLRTDNSGEYLSNDFRAYLVNHGIKHQLTVAYTSQQNGVAERMNRTLMTIVRAIMRHKAVAKRFWAEALSTAVYVRNRVTSRSLPVDTPPHHIWHGTPPDVSRMRVFGSKCWYGIPQSKVRKLDARSKKAMMVGYAAQSKGYKLWHQELGIFVISRDVKFDENGDSTVSINAETFEIGTPKVEDVIESRERPPESEPSADNDDDEGYSTSTQEDPQMLQSTPQYSDNSALAARVVPTSYEVATSPENIEFWGPGIAREEDAIARNDTFDLVQREPWMNVIRYKYLFKVKVDSPKVRIVAMGCHQVHGVEYTETVAPVVKLTSIRIFLATVAVMDLETGQMDVITAFLNGDLDEDIYMEVPDGFKDAKCPELVCELRNALYGLKQAPRQCIPWAGQHACVGSTGATNRLWAQLQPSDLEDHHQPCRGSLFPLALHYCRRLPRRAHQRAADLATGVFITAKFSTPTTAAAPSPLPSLSCGRLLPEIFTRPTSILELWAATSGDFSAAHFYP